MEIIYYGWIEARIGDRSKLVDLGVRGAILYNFLGSCFEHCHVTEAVIKRLIAEWPGFWPNCFTAIDANGNQLPKEDQHYWSYGDSCTECHKRLGCIGSSGRLLCDLCWDAGIR